MDEPEVAMYVDCFWLKARVDGEHDDCVYVSEQLIIRMLTQLSEAGEAGEAGKAGKAGKALAQIPSAYELFDDPLATSFATLVQKSEPCERSIDEFWYEHCSGFIPESWTI